MSELITSIGLGIGLIASVVAVVLSLKKNRREVGDAIVDGFDKLLKASATENARLTARITVLQEEVKGLRQEITTLRQDLNVERLKNEAAELARRLNISEQAMKQAGVVPVSLEHLESLRAELLRITQSVEEARRVQKNSAEAVASESE